METSSKIESHAQDESDTVIKKRKLGEDLSADGSMFADGTLSEPKVDSHEDPSSLEDTVVTDLHGSVAEREIEPTLVMFEVNFVELN